MAFVAIAAGASHGGTGKCVQTKATKIDGGICDGTSIGGTKVCTSNDGDADMAQLVVEFVAIGMSAIDKNNCEKELPIDDNTCPAGTTKKKVNPYCVKGGMSCQSMAWALGASACSADADCSAEGVSKTPKMMCCSAAGNMMEDLCDGWSASDKKMVEEASRAAKACSDSNCFSYGSSSSSGGSKSGAVSLRATTFFPVAAALAALVATVWH